MDNNSLVGKRIRLISMKDSYPVESGTEGTIKSVDGFGQIQVKWDNGRGLAVVPEVDKYIILDESNNRQISKPNTTKGCS